MKLSLLILIGLVILSYGVLISAQESETTANIFTPETTSPLSTEPNLTKEIAQKLSTIATSQNPEDQQLSLAILQEKINESISQSFAETELPEIAIDSIKIKEQNYKGTAEQIKTKKKDDFIAYMVAFYYILASNSPKPITSNSDVFSAFNSIIFDIATSIDSRQTSALDEITRSGEKMLTQLQDIAVPEELLDLHIKALKFTQYAISLKTSVAPNTADPLMDLSSLAKMESFIGSLFSFSAEAQNKFIEYGISYDDVIMEKINNLGAPAPDPKDLEKAAADINASSTSATDSIPAFEDSSTNSN